MCHASSYWLAAVINSYAQQASVLCVHSVMVRLFLPDNFGVLADDVQLEHVSALYTFYQPERHL